MRKTIRIFTALTAAVSLLLLILVNCVGAYLPDSFLVDSNGSLRFCSMSFITAEESGESCLAAAGLSQTRTLKLWGSIPIKSVTAKSVSSPVVLAGGNPFGIKLEADGAVVVGLFDVDGCCPAKECGLKVGDVILSAGGVAVATNEQLSDVVMNSGGRPTELIISRESEQKTLTLTPKLSCGVFRAGINIRDSSAGIGTMTFYDPATSMFAGLGHAVCDGDTGEAFPCGRGSICAVEITGVHPSADGSPGELQGVFSNSGASGSIEKNCSRGLYGLAGSIPSTAKPYALGFRQDIEKGEAYVICTIDGGEPKLYSVEIEKIDLSDGGEKDMVIKVTDKALLAQTGGIVQGMSGSPIIQNGKLVGAVTHVFVKDTCRGYAIFADKMYEEMCGCCDGADALENAG